MAAVSDSDRENTRIAYNLGLVTRLSSKNEEMQGCLELANIAARTLAPVMITGENGTGKSLVALSIHHASSKSSKPCITLRCGTLRENDLKNRLFGSGKEGEDYGLLNRAAGGTLVIDAVDFLPGFIQQDLLTLLKPANDNGFHADDFPLRQFGIRLISTSGNELVQKAANGMFVEELMYYLGEITIRIPPLRERREDIDDLTRLAVTTANNAHSKQVKGLSRTASDFVHHYEFPGNVRELFLMINRAVRETSRDTIYVEDLGLIMAGAEGDGHTHADMTLLSLAEMEKRHINKALLRTGWKKSATARILRISETLLDRKIKLYGLERGSRFD